jgi:uncharacterized protein (DUF1330 family)
MPAYIVARVDVTDPDKYKNYMALTPAAIEKAGGRFVVRGGAITTLEGPEETRRLVILEFDSIEKAKAFYHSPDYERAKQEREGAAEAQFIAVEGV